MNRPRACGVPPHRPNRGWSAILQSIADAPPPFFLLLVSCLWILLSPDASAILDQNENGMSDVWERAHNDGENFSPGHAGFNPESDPDGDGWKNLNESVAGTDPFTSTGDEGLLQVGITRIPAHDEPSSEEYPDGLHVPDTAVFHWYGMPEKRYVLMCSPDLEADSWFPAGQSHTGNGEPIAEAVIVTQEDESPAPRMFWRVRVEDILSDADELTDAEEARLGGSRYFNDTDGNGIDDFVSATAGTNPNGDGADLNGDGMPDNELYNVVFEIAQEGGQAENRGGYSTIPDTNSCYFTKEEVAGYSISNSPRYETVTNGERRTSSTYLDGEALRASEDVQITGIPYETWISMHPVALAPGEYLVWESGGSYSESQPTTTTTSTHTETVRTTTRSAPWTVKKKPPGAPETVLRSGTETITRVYKTKELDPITYPEHWEDHVKPMVWTETGREDFGPQSDIDSLQLRGSVGDKDAAEMIRADYQDHGGLGYLHFGMAGVISHPNTRSESDQRLKQVRWRWVRFNPHDPFNRVYAAPPSSYSRRFHLAVTRTEHVEGEGDTPAERLIRHDVSYPDLIEIECQGGSGWHDVPLSKFNVHAEEYPPDLESIGYNEKSGDTKVSFGSLSPRLVSRDKFLAGSIWIPIGMEELEIEFVNLSTGESLGRYGDLRGGGSTVIQGDVRTTLTEHNGGINSQPENQKVWFMGHGHEFNTSRLDFYACFNSVGTVALKLSVGSRNFGQITHTLTHDSDFAAIIGYVDDWVKGTSFNFGGGSIPVALGSSASGNAGDEALSYLTTACVIPMFNIICQVEGLSVAVMGICDGVRKGLEDDWAFVQLVKSGVVFAGGWAVDQAEAEMERWRDDPVKRAAEIKTMFDGLCQDWVLTPLSELGGDLSTWDGFQRRSWDLWGKLKGGAQTLHVAPYVLWAHVVNGLLDWGDDFCERMMHGAEKDLWFQTLWNRAGLNRPEDHTRRQTCYTFGYTLGYLAEQAAVGAATAGTVIIGKVLVKNGVSLATRLAPRVIASLAMRFHWVKMALNNLELVDDGLRLAYDDVMTSAAREPTSLPVRETPAALMDKTMAREAAQPFDRSTFNFKEWLETAAKNGNIRKLCLTPDGRAVFAKRTSQLMHLLGNDCDAITMKAFMKVAEERVVVARADGSVDEFFEGFFRAFEGNPGLLDNLDSPAHSIAGYSPYAKARLKEFLSDPNPGDLWKFDDPAWNIEGAADIPHKYWVRGIIGELDLFYRTYKPLGYTHHPTQGGYDFAGTRLVQAKTVKNPDGAVEAMKEAIRKLRAQDPTDTVPLTLHIMKKRGTDSAGLAQALDTYSDTLGIKPRLNIIIEAYNIGPQ